MEVSKFVEIMTREKGSTLYIKGRGAHSSQPSPKYFSAYAPEPSSRSWWYYASVHVGWTKTTVKRVAVGWNKPTIMRQLRRCPAV